MPKDNVKVVAVLCYHSKRFALLQEYFKQFPEYELIHVRERKDANGYKIYGMIELNCAWMVDACGELSEYIKRYIEYSPQEVVTTVKAKERKETPVFSGVLNYFPDAIREVARASFAGQQQHNPDKPLAWDRSKSGDELDALARHLLEAGTIDDDGIRHSAKVAWRALANLQKEIEKERNNG